MEPTPTEALLRVERRGGATIATELRSAAPLALRQLADGGPVAHVALVQTAATLLGGDDVSLRVSLGRGARLRLGELSATLAHPVRRGMPGACLRLELTLEAEARLVLSEQPLILAAATRMRRRLTARLAAGATLLHRETLVLGRVGEEAGAASLWTRVEYDGAPLLDETLETGDPRALRSAAVLGRTRALGTLSCYGGWLPSERPEGCAVLAGPGVVLRRAAPRVTALGIDPVERCWGAALLDRLEAPPRPVPRAEGEAGTAPSLGRDYIANKR